jgi:predicted DNA-binding transcriptional regulator YafY
MKAFEQIVRLQMMNDLIKHARTGAPDEFAQRLGISRRQLYSDLDFFRDSGLEIAYCKQRQTFYYSDGHELEISFQFKIMPIQAVKKINGGHVQKNVLCFFSA